MTALIGFVRELVKELNARADVWARDAGAAAFPDHRDRFAVRSSVLRELAGALEAAAKRFLVGAFILVRLAVWYLR